MSGIHHCIADRIAKGEQPLRVWREQSAMTIEQLAKRCGVDQQRLLAIETGVTSAENQELEQIATVLGIHLSDLRPPVIIEDEIPW